MKFFISKDNLVFSTQQGRDVVDAFKLYKSGKGLPTSIGRDAPLDRPSSAKFAELKHIHLSDTTFNSINHQYHRTSDSWLIYAQGFNKSDHFLLIDILTPDAHKRANSHDVINRYVEIAEKFRQHH